MPELPQRKIDSPRTEIILLASLIASLALFFILGFAGGFVGGATDNNVGAWLNYYEATFAGSLPSFIYGAILFLCLAAICLVIWTLSKSFITRAADPRRVFLAALRRSREVWLIIPAILYITIVALAMGEANQFAHARLVDGMVIGWEHALFGVYVFAALGAIHYPHWLIEFIIFSFSNMGLILVGAGILLAYLAPRRFHELIIAFCIGILLMVPIWLLVPVLSPQDRYIDNVYQFAATSATEPPSLAAAVADYHPQSEIANYLSAVRTEKASLPALPTSTFPSAHVFWATLAGYYLFRLRRALRWIAWIVSPFLVASTFGTILLAQHYFMDIPVAIVIAAVAIWLANCGGDKSLIT
jgi:hypothetical protein